MVENDKVRAKFRFTECTTRESGDKDHPIIYDLVFQAVGKTCPENQMFWRFTPAGTIKLSTINQEAAEKFEFSKEYYVDFVPVEK